MIKILYAEDDAMQAKTCIDYLKRAGYKVVHAADGEQALWLYRRETPDLILMDVIMPKMSGFEVAKKIREEDFSTPIPVYQFLDTFSTRYWWFWPWSEWLHT